MTTFNKATLKTFFETGDIPTGGDYANFIDSYVNIVETTPQSMAGGLLTTELVTPLVSAGNITVTGIVSANIIYANNINVSALNLGTATAVSLNVVGDINAALGTVTASAVRSTNGVISSTGIVSAAGTAQATAAVLVNIINRGKGIVDGSTTGFTPLTNRAGLVQYLYNEGVSANLWPPTGGTINGLAVNTPFSLAASSSYTIFHITASAYGVK